MPENYKQATYTVYHVERTRGHAGGLAMMAVAGPPPQTARFVRLHAPVEAEAVSWLAIRDGAPPVVPAPDYLSQGNANYVLNFWNVGTVIATPIDDGMHRYQISGVAVFWLQSPGGYNSGLPTGALPWESGKSPASELLPGTVFQRGILDPGNLPLQSPIQGPITAG